MKSKKEVVVCIISLAFIAILVFNFFPKKVSASNSQQRIKTFVSIEIQKGDTLWNIAKYYRTEEYSSTKQLIAEIKSCNNMSTDTLFAGEYLIVPMYIDIIKLQTT